MMRRDLAGIVHELLFRPLRRLGVGRRVVVGDDPLVTVVCVSSRAGHLEDLLAAYGVQSYARTELILVTNAEGYGAVARELTADMADVQVIETAPSVTLGAALNLGIDAASGEIVAKFDDDDSYAPSYLVHGVAAMRSSGAGVVGKKTYYAYLAGLDQTMLIFPGSEDRRVGRLTGGTLLIHRAVLDRVRFPDRNLGEDIRFVRAVERAGFRVYSADPSGFLQVRSTGHTWPIAERELAADGVLVGPGRQSSYWAEDGEG